MNAVAEDQCPARPYWQVERDAYAPSYVRVSFTPAATWRFTFTFNAADRLVTMVEGAALTTYAYTGYGALESEVTGSQTTTYRYNGQDQLTGVTAPSGVRSTYTFDGDGLRRAAQEGNVAPTTMIWDGSDYLLLSEPTGNRVVLSLESEIVACGTKDLLTDPLGSLVKEISAGAALGSLIELYPYGTLATGAPTIPYVYIAASGYFTDTADRDYVRARELMKKVGRWMQVDMLWPDQPAFGYCNGGPTLEIERSGGRPRRSPRGPRQTGGACGVFVCNMYGFRSLPFVLTHRYVCVKDPNNGCSGGLHPPEHHFGDRNALRDWLPRRDVH